MVLPLGSSLKYKTLSVRACVESRDSVDIYDFSRLSSCHTDGSRHSLKGFCSTSVSDLSHRGRVGRAGSQ